MLGVVAAGVLVAGFASLTFADRPGYRLLLALVLGSGLLLLAWFRPRAAVIATIALLVVIALLRRLLIPLAGWSGWDPLLLVGPLVASFLVLRPVFTSGAKALVPDLMSVLVLCLLLLTSLQILNPGGGGLFAGLIGLLFAGVPLLWYFVGRTVGDRRLATALIVGVMVAGIPEAVYGLWQANFGLPPWDDTWFLLNGYDALHVEDALRPFGTFSSSAEYATFLGFAVTAGMAYLFHRRPAVLASLPLPLWALVESAIRSALAFSVLGMIVMAALRARRTWMTLTVIGVGVAVIAGVLLVLADPLERLAARSGNALVTHTVSGLVHPFDSPSSTLVDHQGLVAGGFVTSFRHPLGYGTGYLGGDKAAAQAVGTEVDISNEFVALGPPGGLLFLAIVLIALVQVIRLYRRRPEPLLLAMVGLLIADLGQWLNGGYYAVAPLLWFLIGWAMAQAREMDASPAPVERPRPWARPALVPLRTGGESGSGV
jgi:hypothetical protein